MRATIFVRLLPVVVLMLASVGCNNQQAMVDTLTQEKAAIQTQLSEASVKATELLAENEALKGGVEAAKVAAAQAEEVLATAKKEAADALAAVEAKMANAATEAKNALDAVNAKVAQLEAALKVAKETTTEEAPAE